MKDLKYYLTRDWRWYSQVPLMTSRVVRLEARKRASGILHGTSGSETSRSRERLAPYCQGYGIDLGFGGDPIAPHAIRMDMPQPYTKLGNHSVQLGGDALDLYWFKDDVLDFVYSSHLLEDFDDTEAALREWLRVLKVGGNLIILCPDEQRYRRHCRRTHQPYNGSHKHANFGLAYVEQILEKIGGVEFVYENDNVGPYSWELVARKVG